MAQSARSVSMTPLKVSEPPTTSLITTEDPSRNSAGSSEARQQLRQMREALMEYARQRNISQESVEKAQHHFDHLSADQFGKTLKSLSLRAEQLASNKEGFIGTRTKAVLSIGYNLLMGVVNYADGNWVSLVSNVANFISSLVRLIKSFFASQSTVVTDKEEEVQPLAAADQPLDPSDPEDLALIGADRTIKIYDVLNALNSIPTVANDTELIANSSIRQWAETTVPLSQIRKSVISLPAGPSLSFDSLGMVYWTSEMYQIKSNNGSTTPLWTHHKTAFGIPPDDGNVVLTAPVVSELIKEDVHLPRPYSQVKMDATLAATGDDPTSKEKMIRSFNYMMQQRSTPGIENWQAYIRHNQDRDSHITYLLKGLLLYLNLSEAVQFQDRNGQMGQLNTAERADRTLSWIPKTPVFTETDGSDSDVNYAIISTRSLLNHLSCAMPETSANPFTIAADEGAWLHQPGLTVLPNYTAVDASIAMDICTFDNDTSGKVNYYATQPDHYGKKYQYHAVTLMGHSTTSSKKFPVEYSTRKVDVFPSNVPEPGKPGEWETISDKKQSFNFVRGEYAFVSNDHACETHFVRCKTCDQALRFGIVAASRGKYAKKKEAGGSESWYNSPFLLYTHLERYVRALDLGMQWAVATQLALHIFITADLPISIRLPKHRHVQDACFMFSGATDSIVVSMEIDSLVMHQLLYLRTIVAGCVLAVVKGMNSAIGQVSNGALKDYGLLLNKGPMEADCLLEIIRLGLNYDMTAFRPYVTSTIRGSRLHTDNFAASNYGRLDFVIYSRMSGLVELTSPECFMHGVGLDILAEMLQSRFNLPKMWMNNFGVTSKDTKKGLKAMGLNDFKMGSPYDLVAQIASMALTLNFTTETLGRRIMFGEHNLQVNNSRFDCAARSENWLRQLFNLFGEAFHVEGPFEFGWAPPLFEDGISAELPMATSRSVGRLYYKTVHSNGSVISVGTDNKTSVNLWTRSHETRFYTKLNFFTTLPYDSDSDLPVFYHDNVGAKVVQDEMSKAARLLYLYVKSTSTEIGADREDEADLVKEEERSARLAKDFKVMFDVVNGKNAVKVYLQGSGNVIRPDYVASSLSTCLVESPEFGWVVTIHRTKLEKLLTSEDSGLKQADMSRLSFEPEDGSRDYVLHFKDWDHGNHLGTHQIAMFRSIIRPMSSHIEPAEMNSYRLNQCLSDKPSAQVVASGAVGLALTADQGRDAMVEARQVSSYLTRLQLAKEEAIPVRESKKATAIAPYFSSAEDISALLSQISDIDARAEFLEDVDTMDVQPHTPLIDEGSISNLFLDKYPQVIETSGDNNLCVIQAILKSTEQLGSIALRNDAVKWGTIVKRALRIPENAPFRGFTASQIPKVGAVMGVNLYQYSSSTNDYKTLHWSGRNHPNAVIAVVDRNGRNHAVGIKPNTFKMTINTVSRLGEVGAEECCAFQVLTRPKNPSTKFSEIGEMASKLNLRFDHVENLLKKHACAHRFIAWLIFLTAAVRPENFAVGVGIWLYCTLLPASFFEKHFGGVRLLLEMDNSTWREATKKVHETVRQDMSLPIEQYLLGQYLHQLEGRLLNQRLTFEDHIKPKFDVTGPKSAFDGHSYSEAYAAKLITENLQALFRMVTPPKPEQYNFEDWFDSMFHWIASGGAPRRYKLSKMRSANATKKSLAMGLTRDDLQKHLEKEPYQQASVHLKPEVGKVRLIYDVDLLHYLISDYFSRIIELGMPNELFDLSLSTSQSFQAHIRKTEACARGKWIVSFDYTTFDQQHQPSDTDILFDCMTEWVKSFANGSDLAQLLKHIEWVKQSFHNQSVIFEDRVYPVAQGLFTGTRLTTIVNTFLNRAYILMVLESLRQRGHDFVASGLTCHGDDVWLELDSEATALEFSQEAAACGILNNESKQLVAPGRGEFLRRHYTPASVNGFGVRTIATLVNGNWESRGAKPGPDNVSSLTSMVNVCVRRCRIPEEKAQPLLFAVLHRFDLLKYGSLINLSVNNGGLGFGLPKLLIGDVPFKMGADPRDELQADHTHSMASNYVNWVKRSVLGGSEFLLKDEKKLKDKIVQSVIEGETAIVGQRILKSFPTTLTAVDIDARGVYDIRTVVNATMGISWRENPFMLLKDHIVDTNHKSAWLRFCRERGYSVGEFAMDFNGDWTSEMSIRALATEYCVGKGILHPLKEITSDIEFIL